MLFDSGNAGLSVNTYQCPWISKFVGTTSNIAALVTAGAHQIEISDGCNKGPTCKPYKICTTDSSGKKKCEPAGDGTHDLGDGVTATFERSYPGGHRRRRNGRPKFKITGPTLAGQCGQRGEVRGYMKKWGKDKMPTGYFWDLYGLLPESLALAADGLCKAEDTCSEIHKANPSVDKQDTKFQVVPWRN